MARLFAELSRCEHREELAPLVGERIEALFEPSASAVYLARDGGFAPAFVRHAEPPPALPASSRIVRALELQGEGLGYDPRTPCGRTGALDAADRAVLEGLSAAAIVPIRRDAALHGLLVLGPPRRGRGYGAAALALLSAVACQLAVELERRRVQHALRRYVPGAVVERVLRGQEMGCGLREVSVLFIDIHGYTRYAEKLAPAEIFELVSRYTRCVSAIAQAHGGSVVEFNGDGMMAVFGAPGDLADKERAAVAAARRMLPAVRQIRVPGNGPVRAGVGIATGDAFVGEIEAVDRVIWSAVGNTTNLAARLQMVTYQLEASIVIDAATYAGAGPDREGFDLHPRVRIRGRSNAFDLYSLPLEGP